MAELPETVKAAMLAKVKVTEVTQRQRPEMHRPDP
jgi:hypothetical protein